MQNLSHLGNSSSIQAISVNEEDKTARNKENIIYAVALGAITALIVFLTFGRPGDHVVNVSRALIGGLAIGFITYFFRRGSEKPKATSLSQASNPTDSPINAPATTPLELLAQQIKAKNNEENQKLIQKVDANKIQKFENVKSFACNQIESFKEKKISMDEQIAEAIAKNVNESHINILKDLIKSQFESFKTAIINSIETQMHLNLDKNQRKKLIKTLLKKYPECEELIPKQ